MASQTLLGGWSGGKAGSYITRFKKTLNSWLAYNGVNVKLKVNVRGESDAPTIAGERVPQQRGGEMKTFPSAGCLHPLRILWILCMYL